MGRTNHPAGRISRSAIAFVVLFFVALTISTVITDLSSFVPSVYAALSLMTFAVYAVDKSAARNAGDRVSEATLHYLSLAGGWPGAILAQQLLRHKSKKAGFRRLFLVTVVLNCGLLVWLHTPMGRTVFGLSAMAGQTPSLASVSSSSRTKRSALG